MPKSPAWVPCKCCDEFWCNLHRRHAFECDCPPIEEWTVDPYSERPTVKKPQHKTAQPNSQKPAE